jgi:cyclase
MPNQIATNQQGRITIVLDRTYAVALAMAVQDRVLAGGAGEYSHLQDAISKGKADAVAAGSLFVFHGRRQAVLISYPEPQDLAKISF